MCECGRDAKGTEERSVRKVLRPCLSGGFVVPSVDPWWSVDRWARPAYSPRGRAHSAYRITGKRGQTFRFIHKLYFFWYEIVQRLVHHHGKQSCPTIIWPFLTRRLFNSPINHHCHHYNGLILCFHWCEKDYHACSRTELISFECVRCLGGGGESTSCLTCNPRPLAMAKWSAVNETGEKPIPQGKDLSPSGTGCH